jgi:hypothetical protein
MLENNKYDVADLVNYAYDQKPLEFVQTFSGLMVDRINTALVDKKIEMAKSIFASDSEDEDYVDDQEETTEEE